MAEVAASSGLASPSADWVADDLSPPTPTRLGPDDEAGAESGMGKGRGMPKRDDTDASAVSNLDWCADLLEPISTGQWQTGGWQLGSRLGSCMKVLLPLRNKRTGQPTLKPRACWEYHCANCGPWRVRLHLRALAEHFDPCDRIYVVRIDDDERTRRIFNDRARQRGANTVRIRGAATVLLLVSVDLRTGRDRRGSLLPRRTALIVARKAMAVPPRRMLRVDGSAGWPMPNGQASSGLFDVFMDMLSDVDWARLRRVVRADLIAAGGMWDRASDLPPGPDPWTWQELIERLREARATDPAEVGTE